MFENSCLGLIPDEQTPQYKNGGASVTRNLAVVMEVLLCSEGLPLCNMLHTNELFF